MTVQTVWPSHSLSVFLSYTSLFLSLPLKGTTDMSAVITSMFKNTYDARAASEEEIY